MNGETPPLVATSRLVPPGSPGASQGVAKVSSSLLLARTGDTPSGSSPGHLSPPLPESQGRSPPTRPLGGQTSPLPARGRNKQNSPKTLDVAKTLLEASLSHFVPRSANITFLHAFPITSLSELASQDGSCGVHATMTLRLDIRAALMSTNKVGKGLR